MVKDKAPDAFEDWLREAEASALLASFAAGIRRDEDAVRAALSEPWSSGQVEGQVNRLKVIKRDIRPRRLRSAPRPGPGSSLRRMLEGYGCLG